MTHHSKRRHLERAGRRQQGGWVLFMVIAALVIIGLGLAQAFGMFDSAFASSNMQTAQTNLSIIQANLRDTWGGQREYTGMSTANAITAGVFPESMVSGTNVYNVWNGTVTVAPNSNPVWADITYTNIPQEECIKLATKAVSGFVEVKQGGTIITDTNSAITACSGTTNALTFTGG